MHLKWKGEYKISQKLSQLVTSRHSLLDVYGNEDTSQNITVISAYDVTINYELSPSPEEPCQLHNGFSRACSFLALPHLGRGPSSTWRRLARSWRKALNDAVLCCEVESAAISLAFGSNTARSPIALLGCRPVRFRSRKKSDCDRHEGVA